MKGMIQGRWMNTLADISLLHKFLAVLVLFALLPALTVGGMGTFLNVTAARQALGQNCTVIASQTAREVKNLLDSTQAAAAVAAAGLSGTRENEAIMARRMISELQRQLPAAELIYVTDAAGRQIARTTGQLRDQSSAPNFLKTTGQRLTWYSDVFISAVSKQPAVTLYTPITSPEGTVKGMLAVSINLEALQNIAGKTAVGQQGYIDIIDSQGRLLAHPDREAVLEMKDAKELKQVQAVLEGQQGQMDGVSSKGEPALITFTPVNSCGWGVIAYLPQRESLQLVLTSSISIAAILAIAILLAAIAAYGTAGSISRPLARLDKTAQELAAGDLTCRAEVSGSREINSLAAALGTMQQNFKKIIGEAAFTSGQLAASSEELTAAAEQAALGIDEVAAAATGLARTAAVETTAVETTAQMIRLVNSSIQEMVQAVQEVNALSVSAACAAQAGDASVAVVRQRMEKIEETVLAAGRSVGELGLRSREIHTILDTIVDIARQTNLLALNAAIEAARAGGEGRGFAVVADEVRQLAEKSQLAAKQIGTMIGHIQQETNRAVTAVEQGNAEVKDGALAVQDAGATFRQITVATQGMAVELQKMSEEIKAISQGSGQMEIAMTAARQACQMASDDSQQVAAITGQQAAAMKEITAASQALAQMAENLQGSVGSFRL